MRIAVVSDIHGSLHALEAVVHDLRLSAADLVLHGGDLAVNGARGDEVVTMVRGLGWPGVVGNTDEMLWRLGELEERVAGAPKLAPVLEAMYRHTAPATLERLSDESLQWLRELPATTSVGEVTVVHAAPRDLWRAPMPDADDREVLETYEGIGGHVVIYGHIHRPYVRDLGDRTVANSGSAGLSWDGDPRASYVIVTDREVAIRRVEYEVDKDVGDLFDTGYPMAEWLAAMRRRASYVFPAEA